MERILLESITTHQLSEFIDRAITEAVQNAVNTLPPASSKQDLTEEFLTRDELAALLKVSKQSLYNWGKKGLIKSTRIGRKALYKRSDVDALINSRKLG